MSAINRKRKSKKNQLSNLSRLVNDGFELFALENNASQVESDIIVHIDRSQISLSRRDTKKTITHRRNPKKPDLVVSFITKNIDPGDRVLISLKPNSYLEVVEETYSHSSRVCEETAARSAILNSPFKKKNTLYFWSRLNDQSFNKSIRVFIMPEEMITTVLIGVSNVTAEIVGIISSDNYLGGQPSSKPDWLMGNNIENYSNLALSSLLQISRMPRIYLLSLIACLFFCASAMLSITYYNYQISSLSEASNVARSTLQKIATSKSLATRLNDMKGATFFNLQLMNEVAVKMKDGNWITRLRINDNAAEISGISNSAADILRHYSEIVGTSNVRMLSSVTRDNETGLERFIIGADLK